MEKIISVEQLNLLEGIKINEAIGVAQKGIHSIKTKKLKGVVIKIDLSKYFDRVSWLYLRMLMMLLKFKYPFIKWVINCIT